MLDKFLEVALEKTKQSSARSELVAAMMNLPNEELMKIANGESDLNKLACGVPGMDGGCSWLDKFKGTPLLEQAIQLEQQELELRMHENEANEQREQMWSETRTQRDQLMVQKKMLELELAKAEAGQASPEPEAPPAPPVPEPQASSGMPPVSVKVDGQGQPKEAGIKNKHAGALVATGAGALGARKAHKANEDPAMGAVRGSAGAHLGGTAGALGGLALSGKENRKAFMEVISPKNITSEKQLKRMAKLLPRAAKAQAAGLAGAAVGTYGGYKALTHKYNKETTKSKQASVEDMAAAIRASMEKAALAITPEGHEYDAAVNRIKEEAALKLLALSQKHKGYGGWTEDNTLAPGSFLKNLRGFAEGEEGTHRMYAHRAALHEKGLNPLNPLGGMLTPHAAEGKGGSKLFLGNVKTQGSTKEAAIGKAAAGVMGALKGAYDVAKSGLTGGKGITQTVKNVGDYASAFAKKNPLKAVGMAAGAAGAAGLGAGYMAGK